MSEAEKEVEKLADQTVLKESATEPPVECNLPVVSKSNAVTPTQEIGDLSYLVANARSISASKNFESLGVHAEFVKLVTTIFLFVLGTAMSVFCVAETIAWPWQLNWPIADGQITKIQFRNKLNADFYYQYRIGEREFKNKEIRADALEHTVKVGKKIRVRYNPKRNEESIMEGGFNFVLTPFYTIVAVGLLAAALIKALIPSKY